MSEDLHHHPLPYTVTLRSATEDDVPMRWTQKVTAYSIVEAAAQAMVLCGGNLPSEEAVKVKFVIEHIGPDVDEYWRQQKARLAEARAALRK